MADPLARFRDETQSTDLLARFRDGAQPEHKPSGTLGAYGQTLKEAVKGIPGYVASAVEGATPYDKTNYLDTIQAQNKARQQRFIEGPNADAPTFGGLSTEREIRQAAPSLSGSMAGMAPSLAGAALGSLAGPVGTVVGGLAGAGIGLIGMKRAAENEFVKENVEKANFDRQQQGLGALSPQDMVALQNQLNASGDTSKIGYSEALPETAGNLAELALLATPAGKLAKGIKELASPLTRAAVTGLAKAGGSVLTELGEEEITRQLQNPIMQRRGFPEQTAAETAKQTVIATLPFAGLAGVTGGYQGYKGLLTNASNQSPPAPDQSSAEQPPAPQWQPPGFTDTKFNDIRRPTWTEPSYANKPNAPTDSNLPPDGQPGEANTAAPGQTMGGSGTGIGEASTSAATAKQKRDLARQQLQQAPITNEADAKFIQNRIRILDTAPDEKLDAAIDTGIKAATKRNITLPEITNEAELPANTGINEKSNRDANKKGLSQTGINKAEQDITSNQDGLLEQPSNLADNVAQAVKDRIEQDPQAKPQDIINDVSNQIGQVNEEQNAIQRNANEETRQWQEKIIPTHVLPDYDNASVKFDEDFGWVDTNDSSVTYPADSFAEPIKNDQETVQAQDQATQAGTELPVSSDTGRPGGTDDNGTSELPGGLSESDQATKGQNVSSAGSGVGALTDAQKRLDTIKKIASSNIDAGLTKEDFLKANADKAWKYDKTSPYYQNIDLLKKDLIESGYGNQGQLPKLFDEVLNEKNATQTPTPDNAPQPPAPNQDTLAERVPTPSAPEKAVDTGAVVKELALNNETQIRVKNKSISLPQVSQSILDEYGIKVNVTPDKNGTVKITLPSKHATQSLTTLTKELRKSGNDILTGATENELFIYAKPRATKTETPETNDPTPSSLMAMPLNTKEEADNYVKAHKRYLDLNGSGGTHQPRPASWKPPSVRNPETFDKLEKAWEVAGMNYWQMPYEEAIKLNRFRGLPKSKWESARKERNLPLQETLIEQETRETEKAPQGQETAAKAKRLDHGELNIPGRTNNINAELDQYKKEQSAQEKVNDKANLDDTRRQKAEISTILADKDFIKSKAKALNKTVKDVEQAVNTMTYQAREKFIEAYNRERTPQNTPDILSKTKKQYILDQKRAWLKEHKNALPQAKAKAFSDFETNYETEIERAHASLPFEQYKALPENKGQSDGVLRQVHEQLRNEYGIAPDIKDESKPKETKAAEPVQKTPESIQVAEDVTKKGGKVDTSVKFSKGKSTGSTRAELINLLNADDKKKLQAGEINIYQRISDVPKEVLNTGDMLTRKNSVPAWHGSPHDHNKFDSSKIGTGEGAQAFGYGHYFTDKKEIAEWYRTELSSALKPDYELYIDGVKIPKGADRVLDYLSNHRGDFDETVAYFTKQYEEAVDQAERFSDIFQDPKSHVLEYKMMLDFAEGLEESGQKIEVKNKNSGKLYQVELAPEPDELLDWDKPLSEQSDKLKGIFGLTSARDNNQRVFDEYRKQALEKTDGKLGTLSDVDKAEYKKLFALTQSGVSDSSVSGNAQGSIYYNRLSSKLGNDKKASEYLHSLGVRGIRYKAEQGKSDASNYVIFSDDDISIKEKYSKDEQIEGFYKDGKIYIIADNVTPENLPSVLNHEKLHASLDQNPKLRERLLGAQSELNDIFDLIESGEYTGRYKELYDAAMKRVDRAKTAPTLRFEEWLAYQVTEWNKSPKNLPERLAKAIANMVAAIKAAIYRYSGYIGKISPADLSALAVSAMKYSENPNSSNAVAMASKAQSKEQQEYDDTRAQYSGTKDWMKAPNGKPTNLNEVQWVQTRTPSFKKWFGDSKVIDENGDPLVVYHGTKSDFNTFTKGDIGYHFGTKQQANFIINRLENYKGEARVIGVYLKSENMIRLPDVGFGVPNLTLNAIFDAGYITKEQTKNIRDEMSIEYIDKGTLDAKQEALKNELLKLGFDGIVYKNTGEPDTNFDKSDERRYQDSYITFEPNQIKSAIGNTGAFSPESNDIRFSVAPPQKSSLWNRWFGKSKMKRGGEPIKFYHGSSADFTVFDKGDTKSTRHPSAELGHFFAEDKGAAAAYGGKIHEVYLSMQNPYIITSELLDQRMGDDPAKFAAKLKQDGFDGIYIKDAKYAVIFDSNQAKLTSNESPTFGSDIRYSIADDVKDFITGTDRTVNSLSDIDTILQTGKMPQKKIDMQSVMDKAATMLVDATRPFDVLMRKIPNIELASHVVRDKDLAKRKVAVKEKEALDTFLKPLAKIIGEVSKDIKFDYRATHQIMGEWMTVRYALEKNQDYIRQDQEAVNQAQDALNNDPTNSQLKSALTRAKNAQKERLDAINEQKWIDPRSERLQAKLAGGYNNFTAKTQMAKYEGVISKTKLEEAAKHVYAMNKWKTALDLSTGKVTQEQVDKWFNSPHYVPLTGDPSIDTSEDELFSHGSVNQQTDKRAIGRTGSIAQNGIDAAVEQVQKSARYYGWGDFKDSLYNLYDGLIQEELDNGATMREAQDAVMKNYQLSRSPLREGFVSETGITYRKGNEKWVFDLHNQEAVDALKSINKEEIPSLLQPVANFTRTYSRFVTQLMPGFGAINAIRDTWERTENIRARALPGYETLNMNKVANDAIKNASHPSIIKKLMGVMLEGTGLEGSIAIDPNDADIKNIREMIKAGATSTVGDYLAQTNKDLSKQMKDSLSLSSKGWGYVNAWNNAFELVSTYSLYKSLKDNGVDTNTAAAGVLNLMNFSKSGTITGPLKALYVFTNPIFQGGNQLIKTLSTPVGQKRAAAYLLAGMALYGMLRAIDGDDDELGENKMDNQSSFMLERNIHIPFGDVYIKIPIGFGMPQAMWSAAINLDKMMFGTQDIAETAVEIVKSFSRTLAPVSPSEASIIDHPIVWLTQTLTPQIAKPIMNVGMDVNMFGQPLTNTRFARSDKALALQGRKSTPEEYKDIAANLGKMGINVYPEQVREIVRGYAVGPFNEVIKAFVENPNKELLGRNTVNSLVDRFVSSHDTSGLKERLYYRYRDEMNQVSVKHSLGKELSQEEAKLLKLHNTVKKLESKANGKLAAATKAENKRPGFKSPYRKEGERIRETAMNLVIKSLH